MLAFKVQSNGIGLCQPQKLYFEQKATLAGERLLCWNTVTETGPRGPYDQDYYDPINAAFVPAGPLVRRREG